MLVQDVIWEIAKRRSEQFEYSSTLEWEYELTGAPITGFDGQYSNLEKFLSNDIEVTPGSGARNLTQSSEEVLVKVKFKVGSDLSVLADNKIDSLRFNLVFSNLTHENMSFSNPVPIQGSVWLEKDSMTFYKTVTDLEVNQIAELEFRITVVSSGNYTDVNLLANEDNVVAQCQGILLQDIYSDPGLSRVSHYQTGLPSDLQKRAYATLSYYEYMNFIIEIPLTFSYSI